MCWNKTKWNSIHQCKCSIYFTLVTFVWIFRWQYIFKNIDKGTGTSPHVEFTQHRRGDMCGSRWVSVVPSSWPSAWVRIPHSRQPVPCFSRFRRQPVTLWLVQLQNVALRVNTWFQFGRNACHFAQVFSVSLIVLWLLCQRKSFVVATVFGMQLNIIFIMATCWGNRSSGVCQAQCWKGILWIPTDVFKKKLYKLIYDWYIWTFWN